MTRGRRLFLGALVGLLAGGGLAYLLVLPATSPGQDPRALRPYAVVPPSGRSPASPLLAGRPAPDFTLPSLRGGQLRLSDFRGKVVLLNFFASWCAPCAAEAPDLRTVYERYRNRGVVFVGVAVLDEVDAARAFLQRHGLPYPAVFDRSGRLMERYQITGLPTSIFIDPSGMLVDRFVGPFIGPAGAAELERRLVRAGAGTAP
ncbi:MAG: TlpA disulfide reductase family protein [Armatimonadota bacterium]|nr:TlpA disulfide reductase family protein [Armatimonadota bacterium]MDR7426402.1 TlpA disulfide reductase family protein [Armatimonadota bacterium]MDR7463039.1 TlpA disulfide reductase family protein [Armatimonadota bacterium]MDR7469533.1 TlpA disulfide reductase family protein [Armatimonadota bacterium]MDR7473459.1 TlpA disulfide reductase family protein [Armatimonadota bacterium]